MENSIQTKKHRTSARIPGKIGVLLVLSLIFFPALNSNNSGFQAQPVGGNLFKFKLEVDDVLIVDKYQDIRINYGNRIVSKEEKNRIVLKVVAREGNVSVLEGHFHTYSRSPRKVGEYKLESNFYSKFKIHDNGHYEVPDKYIMPNLRDLPTFPAKAIRGGTVWQSPAMETIDFKTVRVKIPVKVTYKYTGIKPLIPAAGKKIKKGPYHRFEYRYTVRKRVRNPRSPVRGIAGFSTDEFWFDKKEGVPVFDSNRIAYTFITPTGRNIDFHFKILSWYKKIKRIKPKEKKKIVDQVKKDLKDDKKITVKKAKDGIVLTMDAILFNFDSARLSPESESSIQKIAGVLKKYPNREIRISGHTDSRGRPRYNQKLSRRRARSVLKVLRERGIGVKRMSYKGFGETKPVADNRTKVGRKKNRRVEILIVTE